MTSMAPVPPVSRIPDLLHLAAERFGDAPFVCRSDGTRYMGFGFRAASDAVTAFAAALAARGVAPGMAVALQAANGPEWGLAYLAILEAGAVVVPLDAQLRDADLGEILTACGARWAVAGAGERENIGRVIAARGIELEIVALEEVGMPAAIAIPSNARGAPRSSSRTNVRPISPSGSEASDTLAAILFTSGTTGRAKGVMLTHANVLTNVEAIFTAFHFDPSDRFLSVLPLHHAFECTAGFLGPLRAGASIAYARSLKSGELREDLSAFGATIMLGVPLLFEKLLAAIVRGVDALPPARRSVVRALVASVRQVRRGSGLRGGRAMLGSFRSKAGLGTVRMFVTGAAPLRPEIFWGFADLGFTLLEGYGLTECSPVVCANRPERSEPGTVGWPIPGVALRILEPDTQAEGEVLVRGPNVMSGYFCNPEATSRVLEPDGWFHTGDIGRVLPDGRLVLTGRRKNLIVTAAGKKIYPEEIEARISSSPRVLEVAVVAGLGPHAREEVHAHVVPNREAIEALARAEGVVADEAFVRATIEREVEGLGRDLAPFKRVHRVIVRDKELPKTSTGKVRRDALA